jgi:crotonobetainyl-CoA:carnitine CoA-transferase CaiB-like acyl-CoA transferase
VPAGPIHTVPEALNSDQAQARGAVREMARDDVAGGAVQVLGNPLHFSRTPVSYRRPPPRFGEDTDAVLAALREGRPDDG